MIDRHRLFGVPTYRRLAARGRIELEYAALTGPPALSRNSAPSRDSQERRKSGADWDTLVRRRRKYD
jgi:hypothetical protein